MKGKYKSRTSRVTPKEALDSCPTRQGRNWSNWLLGAKLQKTRDSEWEGGKRDADAFLPSLISLWGA